MVLYTILIAVALIVIMLIATLAGRSQRKTATARFGRRFGLEVPEGLELSIRAAVMSRHIGALIGVTISEIIATAILLTFPGLQLLATWWVLFASYLVGAGIGSAMAMVFAERRREQGVVRIARTTAVALDDYVSSFQRGFAWFSVVVAIVAFAGDCWLVATESHEYLSLVSGVLTGISVVMLVVYEVVGRRFVATGAFAGTTLELAWDDALRAYALSNLNVMVALTGLYSLIGYDTLLVSNPSAHVAAEPMFSVYTGLFPVAATVGIVALVAFTTRIRARQYFLRRLWPSLAARVDDNVAGTYTSMMGGH